MKKIFFILFFSYNAFSCQKWPYLKSAAFKKARQERVAQIVSACDTIIEIGGAGTPMSDFAHKDQTVIVIDPDIKRKEEGTIRHLSFGFEKWKEWPISKNYAVVILGLHLIMPDGAWRKLYDLIEGSAITVIEYSAHNTEAKKQFKDIKKSVTKAWAEPQEIEINGHELAKYEGWVFNHWVLQHTVLKQTEEKNE